MKWLSGIGSMKQRGCAASCLIVAIVSFNLLHHGAWKFRELMEKVGYCTGSRPMVAETGHLFNVKEKEAK